MSLSSQVSSLATRLGQEVKALWLAINAKAPIDSPTFTNNVVNNGAYIRVYNASGAADMEIRSGTGAVYQVFKASSGSGTGNIYTEYWKLGVRYWLLTVTDAAYTLGYRDSGGATVNAFSVDRSTFPGRILLTRSTVSGDTGLTVVTKDYVDTKAPIASPTFTGTVTTPTLDLTTAATSAAATSYWVETGSDGIVRPKSLSNVKSELVVASEVLTKIKTVDGSGSGLDADLLDGNEATAFVFKTGDTMSGNLTILNTATNYSQILLKNNTAGYWISTDPGSNNDMSIARLNANGSYAWSYMAFWSGSNTTAIIGNLTCYAGAYFTDAGTPTVDYGLGGGRFLFYQNDGRLRRADAATFRSLIGAAASSKRFKVNIKDATKIPDISKLKPATFNWKNELYATSEDEFNKEQFGLIAEEVAKIDPRLVTESEGEIQGINVVAMLSALVHKVQELEKRLEQ